MSLRQLGFAITLLVLHAAPLQAQDYFYFGLSAGYGSLNEDAPSIDTDAVAADISAPEGLSLVGEPTADFGYRIDDDSVNWGLFGGFNFNNYFAAEGGYTRLGKSSVSSDLRAQVTTTLPDPLTGTQTSEAVLSDDSSITTSVFHISGIARYPFVNKFNYTVFSVYGRAGVTMWNTDVNTNRRLTPFSLQTSADTDPPSNEPLTGDFSNDDEGVNFLFGVGADYRLTTSFRLRAEWTYYRGINGRDINLLSGGIVYQYGL